jgi:molybdopterin molybdotransferase
MPQLTDDCFAHGGAPMTIAEALALFAARVRPVEAETVGLWAADGRVLAEDVVAPVPLPQFDNTAVDGWAVRHADIATDRETRLAVVDRVQAGDRALVPLGPGEAARVFTGAPMPPGADTVYMQEDARAEAGTVTVPPGLKRGANARPAGEELASGQVALPTGRRLRPQDVALAAAVGRAELLVRRRLRIAVFSTGNELVEPGRPLGPAQLYDSNRVMLGLLAARLGIAVTDMGRLADDPDSIRPALAAAAQGHDLIVTSGGVSTGEADHVKDAVAAVGQLHVWRFAIKPGRPLAFGTIGGAAFVGLPGNPVAVYVTFTQVVRGLVAALAGEAWTPPEPVPARAGFAYAKKPGRLEFVRVRLAPGPDGVPVASRFATEGAAIIRSLTETTGIARVSEKSAGFASGDMVEVIPFAFLP